MLNLKPKIFGGSLINECNQKIRYQMDRVKGTITLPVFDKTPHNQAQQKIANKLINKGYTVRKEVWLTHEYEEFALSHPIDIIAQKSDGILAVEIKPEDSSRYDPQYQAAMLLLEHNYANYKYIVFSYKTEEFTQKYLPQLDFAEEVLRNRVELILSEVVPFPGAHCNYCKFGMCEYSPYVHSDELEGLI
ncbi:MAG: hypothetical protein INQ03_00480 [Candidatus Heimdallarchaeota archaeon]|nr:hypothetical protein [Candidatus Heimdallarchaeota archaeon]